MSSRLHTLFAKYPKLRIAVIGDFCLDRYLEIDPARTETSIETGLPVHNVVRVRSQPGGAGTILNNLAALGIGALYPVGFCGLDGEGFELQQALRQMPGVRLDYFLETPKRRTFTYCKPLLVEPNRPPRELNRLDSKNWSPTPPEVTARLAAAVRTLATQTDALILLDQVDLPETGVITSDLLQALHAISEGLPHRWILADSRRGLAGYPPVCLKMNAGELAAMTGHSPDRPIAELCREASSLARRNRKPVFVTLSERGILGAGPEGNIEHLPCHPIRGPIDVVGAGDAVTANLAAVLAAGGDLRSALAAANAAASLVIHQLGTTGTAHPSDIEALVAAQEAAASPAA